MKRLRLFLLLVITLSLIGCNSSKDSQKILGFIELYDTPSDKIIEKFNLEQKKEEIWDEDKGIFTYILFGYFAEYTLGNVDGTLCVNFDGDYASSVIFTAEANSSNMENIVSYLVENYGKNYKKIDDDSSLWTSGDLIIDYELTGENTVEITWYSSND